jgi:hypothetical protein
MTSSQRPHISIVSNPNAVRRVEAQEQSPDLLETTKHMTTVLGQLHAMEAQLEKLRTAELEPAVTVVGGETIPLRDIPRDAFVRAKLCEIDDLRRQFDAHVDTANARLNSMAAKNVGPRIGLAPPVDLATEMHALISQRKEAEDIEDARETEDVQRMARRLRPTSWFGLR